MNIIPKTILLLAIFLAHCSGSYVKKIQETETAFYHGNIEQAVSTITPLAQDASTQDKLLLYMEAGLIYHTHGDYQTSNRIFQKADELCDEIRTSITGEMAAFLLSDREKEFHGENFERVLVKYYLALNYILLNDLESAKRTLRKLEADLKEMKYEEAAYKQILTARYLDALVSEELGEFNDVRVQYKNLELLDVDKNFLNEQRFFLAQKTGDADDLRRYKKFAPAPFTLLTAQNAPVSKDLGELVILLQRGKAAAKESRGNLLNDQEFSAALRVAIYAALMSRSAGISTAGVFAMLGAAENPIPKYIHRDIGNEPVFTLNDQSLGGFTLLTDYDDIAVKNFNDRYQSYITKNVASIATKIVIAAIAADQLSRSAENASGGNNLVGTLGRFVIGLGAGGAVAASIKPDLRGWRTLPARFEVLRIRLPAGKYRLNQLTPQSIAYPAQWDEFEIKKDRKHFKSIRIFSR